MKIDHSNIQGIGGWRAGYLTYNYSPHACVPERPPVPALLRKGLAIHRNDEGKGWKLSHVRSGLMVGRFRTKNLAHACGELLLQKMDFDREAEELSSDHKLFAGCRALVVLYQTEQHKNAPAVAECDRHFTHEELAP